MRRIVRDQATYCIVPRRKAVDAPGYRAVAALAGELQQEFGVALVLEIWTDEALRAPEGTSTSLVFQARIHIPAQMRDGHLSRSFYHNLSRLRIADTAFNITYARRGSRLGPRGVPDIFGDGVVRIGLALSPAFREAATNEVRPIVLRHLRQQLTVAVQRLFYQFTRSHTRLNPAHHFSLGKRAFRSIARAVDRRLSDLSRSFDLIMLSTPVNGEEAWKAFRTGGYEAEPRLLYRPIGVDPDAMKRELWSIPIGRINDPSVEQLFFAKRDELDIRLSMLLERNSRRFLYDGLRLYGTVSEELYQTALDVLARARPSSAASPGSGSSRSPRRRDATVRATAFARIAEAELAHFRQALADHGDGEPPAELGIEVRPGFSSMLAVQGKLFVGRSSRVREDRVSALVQHEIGTHILTFVNGMRQPFRLLGSGLDGYEALQEGLAVVAEYLAGGLDGRRLRALAARVIAAKAVADGAQFVETFRVLARTAGLSRKRAFQTAVRVHRGGGFVKDLIYLKGLGDILSYLGAGGDLELLWTGKVGLHHIRLLQELRYRKILLPPLLIPSYTRTPEYDFRSKALSDGLAITDLIGRA